MNSVAYRSAPFDVSAEEALLDKAMDRNTTSVKMELYQNTDNPVIHHTGIRQTFYGRNTADTFIMDWGKNEEGQGQLDVCYLEEEKVNDHKQRNIKLHEFELELTTNKAKLRFSNILDDICGFPKNHRYAIFDYSPASLAVNCRGFCNWVFEKVKTAGFGRATEDKMEEAKSAVGVVKQWDMARLGTSGIASSLCPGSSSSSAPSSGSGSQSSRPSGSSSSGSQSSRPSGSSSSGSKSLSRPSGSSSSGSQSSRPSGSSGYGSESCRPSVSSGGSSGHSRRSWNIKSDDSSNSKNRYLYTELETHEKHT